MMSRKPAIVLLLGLVACGARSPLFSVDVTSSGGAGGTGGVGGSGGWGGSIGGSGGWGGSIGGSAGSGGSGGSTVECYGLAQFGSVVEVERPKSKADDRPALVRSSDDGQQITVAFQRRKLEGPNMAREATHASFRPWQSWPSGTLSPTYTTFASPDLDPGFAVGAGFGDRFALLVSHALVVDSFSPSVDPNAPDAGPNLTLSTKGKPIFVAPGPPGLHLVADSDGHMLMGHVVRFTGGSFDVKDIILACGQNATIADAVAYQDGWLVALGNEATAPQTGCSAAANGPTRLDLLYVAADGTINFFTSGGDNGVPLVGISVAPYPDGAWVTWKTMSGGAIAPIRGFRWDMWLAGVVDLGDLTGPGDAPLDDFHTAALGDRLAVVWRNDPGGNPPDLTLSVLDTTGVLVAQTFIEPKFQGPLSVIGSPDGNSLVVSWDEGGDAVKLARFDCAGGL